MDDGITASPQEGELLSLRGPLGDPAASMLEDDYGYHTAGLHFLTCCTLYALAVGKNDSNDYHLFV